jgi:acetate kinase
MSGCIAVINAGSSSIKFGLYDELDEALLFRGLVESIGIAPHLRVSDSDGKSVADQQLTATGLDHRAAIQEIVRVANALLNGRQVVAVGHRAVHGGTTYAAPLRIDAETLNDLERLIPLAPLHQPHNLAPIRAIATQAHRPA